MVGHRVLVCASMALLLSMVGCQGATPGTSDVGKADRGGVTDGGLDHAGSVDALSTDVPPDRPGLDGSADHPTVQDLPSSPDQRADVPALLDQLPDLAPLDTSSPGDVAGDASCPG